MNGRLQLKEQPPEQVGLALAGAVQTTPHLPQFEVSVFVSTQEPLQSVSAPQLAVHMPPLQTSPAAHAFEQLPQCCAFDCVSMHSLPHAL